MTHDELAREFHILNGGKWHFIVAYGEGWNECSCGFRTDIDSFLKHKQTENPTYSTAESVLEVMMKRHDYYQFITSLRNDMAISQLHNFIDNFIIQPDKLLTAAVEFCKENKI